jgi:hypothetical protein
MTIKKMNVRFPIQITAVRTMGGWSIDPVLRVSGLNENYIHVLDVFRAFNSTRANNNKATLSTDGKLQLSCRDLDALTKLLMNEFNVPKNKIIYVNSSK